MGQQLPPLSVVEYVDILLNAKFEKLGYEGFSHACLAQAGI